MNKNVFCAYVIVTWLISGIESERNFASSGEWEQMASTHAAGPRFIIPILSSIC